MSTWDLLEQKRGDFGPWLRRSFWLPLRRWLQMFHVLPVTAALALFALLAVDGQLREIYVSYLEDVGSGGLVATAFRFFAAALGFGLISAVIYEAHYLLSRARSDVIYAMNTDPDTGSNVQDAAGIVLAMAPWLGLVAGLLHAKLYLAGLFKLLQTEQAPNLWTMQHVPMPSDWAIAVGIIVLGLVLSLLVAGNPRSPTLQRSVIILTPPSAALLFLLLTDPPQFNPNPLRMVAIALAVSAVVAVYYFGYTIIRAMRPYVFSRTLQEKTGINLRRYQPLFLFLLSLLPWVATIAGYLIVAPPPPKQGELHGWAMIAVAMSWTVSIGLCVVFLLYRFRRKPALKWSIYGTVLVLALLGLGIAWTSTDWTVTVYRLIGPLGTLAFAVQFLISIFALLAALSQRSAFPALTLVILALVGSVALPMKVGVTVALLTALCLVIFGMAMVSQLWSVAAVAVVITITGAINLAKLSGIDPLTLRQAAKGSTVDQQFKSWLSNRLSANDAGGTGQTACAGNFRQYPVYIIAATGGGIYAASAASMLLARLQDRAPCFTEHVFAISAVSGGAIGATIFEALAQSTIAQTPSSSATAGATSAAATPPAPVPGCLPPQYKDEQPAEQKPDLEDDVAKILEGDHFSPLVASIFPELLGFTHTGRAPELAASFEQSVNGVDRGAAQTLCEPFAQQWSTASKVPALVLNATWVETGYRAALAPFPLHAIDDSLYSFDDRCMPADDPNAPSGTVTTIGAALVSARFPAILPPYSVLIKKPGLPDAKKGECPEDQNGSGETMRWNFVDGGYSDTTGATTALALYQALNQTANEQNIKLRMILLTSSDPQLNPDDINGTIFADTLAPIDAMLSVRDGLGNEAVARTCNGIVKPTNGVGGQNLCKEDLSNDSNSPLQIVGIDDETYGLSLGWKISQTTFSVVSWMLGKPEFANEAMCKDETAGGANPTPQSNGQFTRNNKVVCANSRVLNIVLRSFGYPSLAQ